MPDSIGEIRLMNFQDCKNTNKINDDLNAALTQYNKKQSKTPELYNLEMEYLYQTASKLVIIIRKCSLLHFYYFYPVL